MPNLHLKCAALLEMGSLAFRIALHTHMLCPLQFVLQLKRSAIIYDCILDEWSESRQSTLPFISEKNANQLSLESAIALAPP